MILLCFFISIVFASASLTCEKESIAKESKKYLSHIQPLNMKAAYAYYKYARQNNKMQYMDELQFEKCMMAFKYAGYVIIRFLGGKIEDLERTKKSDKILLSDLKKGYQEDGSDNLQAIFDREKDYILSYNTIFNELLLGNNKYEKYLGINSILFDFEIKNNQLKFGTALENFDKKYQYAYFFENFVVPSVSKFFHNDVCPEEILNTEFFVGDKKMKFMTFMFLNYHLVNK